jgi:hypothetical protein
MFFATRPVLSIQSLSLIVLITASALPAATASQEPVTNRAPFRLKAVVEDMPQLTREGLDRGSGTRSSPSNAAGTSDSPIAAVPLTGSVEELGEFPGGSVIPPQPRQEHDSAPPSQGGFGGQSNELPGQSPPDDEPNGSVMEYGVDWATWVSKLADKWFFSLKKLEEQSGLQFHTVRPALIHFTCYPNGQIDKVYVKQSCGIPLYDQMQIQALANILPLHRFPKGTRRASFTLVQGWESHPRRPGEEDFRPGSFGKDTPMEVVQQWVKWR